MALTKVTTGMIADGAVTLGKIATAAVDADKIATDAVTAAKIAAGAVGTDELASNAVTTVKITDANVTTAKIADANVTTAKIADVNVTTAKIADSNVTTAKIATDAVTADKIVAGAVGTSELASDAVTPVKLPATAIGYGFALHNGYITASIAANALTIAIKTLAGADPSSSDPVRVIFNDETQATGTPDVLSITAASSLVVSSGSTLGAPSATAFRIYVVQFNNGGTLRLGVVNCKTTSGGILGLDEGRLASSTAEGGAGAADSAHTFYTGTVVTSKPYRILGSLTWNSGLAVAGTWDAAPTVVHQFGPGSKKPGDIAGIARGRKTDTQSQTPVAGTWYAVASLTATPTIASPANVVHLVGHLSIGVNSATVGLHVRAKRDSTVIGVGDAASSREPVMGGNAPGAADNMAGIPIDVVDATPGTGSPAYTLEVMEGSTAAFHINRSATDTDSSSFGRGQSTITATEIVA